MFQELVSNITNVGVFTESFGEWISGISINSAIVFIMMIFMLVGAIDKIAGNKRGYGEKFDEGFNAMGPLAAAMAGVVAAAPVLCIILKPIIAPIYTLVGADPSMFATTLLACDMGGYPLAMQMAANESVGNFAGLILGTMMGPTIVFTIPVALSIIKKSDKPYLGAGVLAGLITVPIGCIVGGLAMNMTQYKMGIGTILVNLIPVIIIAGLIVVGLWVIPDKMIRGFDKFGSGVTIVITIFTAIAMCCFAFSTILGWGLYGARCIEFVFTTKIVKPFMIVYALVAILGATVDLGIIWGIADTCNGLMSIPNLIALFLMSGTVAKLVKDYFAKEKKKN